MIDEELLKERNNYPCSGYECYEHGNYHTGCSTCLYFKKPVEQIRKEKNEQRRKA